MMKRPTVEELPIRGKGRANVPLESEGMTTQNWEGGVAEVGIAKQTLLDTGAWLSYVSLSFANKIEKELMGVRGKGRYKVIDPFQKAHYFFDDISFCMSLITGDIEIDQKTWPIKAVIVNIDFTADFLLGLKDIKRVRLFKYLPDLVEGNEQECQ